MGRRTAIAAAVIVAIAAGVWFGGRVYLARSVAQYDGRVDVDVAAPVEITFDAKGIPQIWAKTDADAYFAIGWVHASERLFQMELVRRLARGELSEVFGEAAFETDSHQRRIGFARRARADVGKLSPAARAAMERYLEGVNAWIAQASPLPPEFVALRLRPRRWELEDCLAITAYQTWFSHELMDQDRKYQRLLEKIGAPADALMHAGHPWSFTTVDPPAANMSGASNSWAVAPSRSKSGKALHAADPHLAVNQAPGLWYLAGLHSDEGLNVVGATYAGAPFVVMGHNADIAFSFTVASIDLIDYYDDNFGNVVRSVDEEIRVKGEAKPRIIRVNETPRGVLIDPQTSLRWAGFDFSAADGVDAGLRLQRARTFDEFRRAVTRFGALDANWIYSDREGNVGYQLGAPIPIRDYDSYVRQHGGNWTGYVPFERTPHAMNPAKGFVASCNNQVTTEPLPGFYDPYRITRAHALLGGTRKLGVEDMRAFQLDEQSGIALRWKKLAGLDAWDGRMSANSRDAALFGAWWSVLPRVIFEDELGEEWKTGKVLLDEALTTGSPVLDDKRTPRVETRDDVAKRAMAEARTIANGRTWGEANTLLVRHPLSRVKALDWWLRLNRGPLPAPGDPGTLNANFHSFDEKSKTFRSAIGPSMRFVLDWADVDAFTLTGALGQSGNPFSPHYADFLPLVRRGEAWTVPFSREKVFAEKAAVLRLE